MLTENHHRHTLTNNHKRLQLTGSRHQHIISRLQPIEHHHLHTKVLSRHLQVTGHHHLLIRVVVQVHHLIEAVHRATEVVAVAVTVVVQEVLHRLEDVNNLISLVSSVHKN